MNSVLFAPFHLVHAHLVRAALAGLALLAGFVLPAAHAQQALQASTLFDEASLRQYVSQQVAGSSSEPISRFDVRLGQVEASPAMALCRRSEPFTPAGGRFWGRSSLGVRCVEGASWSVLVPLTVTAWGRAVVAAMPLPAGTVLDAQNLREDEVELTREAVAPVRDIQLLAGRTLTRAVSAGQGIRLDMVRTTAVVQSGDAVRLRLNGPGFTVAASGLALTSAGAGQTVRVKTDLGKIVTGIARDDRVVDLSF
jgi:flagella basal body P-ring formation protein FlgA